MNVRYRVTLDTSERVQLVSMVLGGKAAVRKLKRAQILLAADNGSTDEEIARNVSVGTSTVYRVKQRFVEEGLERALNEAPRPGADRKFDSNDEAMLVAVACSKPPAGRARWTLRLLANEMARLTEHESALSANVAETPASPKISVEGDRGMNDDKSDGETDRGVVEGNTAAILDGREAPGSARGRHRRARGWRCDCAAAT